MIYECLNRTVAYYAQIYSNFDGCCFIVELLFEWKLVPTVCSHEDTETCEEEGTITSDGSSFSCKIVTNASDISQVCGM